MNQPFPVHSFSPYQWKLHLSILDANDDPKNREAPWYCTWDLVLRDQIFANFCKPPYFTLTYPQFPMSRNIDTYHPADDIVDSDEDEDDSQGSDLGTPSPNHRHGAPSPEIFRGSPNQLLYTPPGPKRDKLSPSGCKSTRIPDFAQLLFEVRMNEGMVPRPIEYRIQRLLAITEIKKYLDRRRPKDIDFMKILPQTDQQARRAFTMFSSTVKLGVIIAIGAYWTYFEYDKYTIRPSPSGSEQQDSVTPSAMHYDPLMELFRPDIFARLESPASDKGLNMVRSRVKYLSGLGREA